MSTQEHWYMLSTIALRQSYRRDVTILMVTFSMIGVHLLMISLFVQYVLKPFVARSHADDDDKVD